jgi:hypothetical protein
MGPTKNVVYWSKFPLMNYVPKMQYLHMGSRVKTQSKEAPKRVDTP